MMVLFSMLEELLIGEGGFRSYLIMPQHRLVRFFIRGLYALILFLLGYFGLKKLQVKWITHLWFLWYFAALIIVTLRIIISVKFKAFFGFNFWNFCIPFYNLLLTPFPYLFLLMIHFLFNQERGEN
jgi:hypothetical protein